MNANDASADGFEGGRRFAFGRNWSRFLLGLTDERICAAEQSLRETLGITTLLGKRFLDAGSGSGLFSLAAMNLGAAAVHSFDYDPQSVACTDELKRRFHAGETRWRVEQGSVLDTAYLSRLGQFDVVYSWGVLHHTGSMYEACANICQSVAADGTLVIAIYNDQGPLTKYWTHVKRAYNANAVTRALVVAVHAPYLLGLRWLVRAATGRRTLERGMSLWRDMLDWLGGYPFEAAKPEAIFHFFRERGFVLERLRTCGGRMGCNEFVLRRRGQ